MTRKIYLILALVVALAIAGGTFAYTETSATVSANVTGSSSFASVDYWNATDTWGEYDALPTWTPLEGNSGTITAGDLYYITDPGTSYSGNLLFMVYVTNGGEVADAYSYLNMQIHVYDYTAATDTHVLETEIDYYLTLSNGYVSFILPPPDGDGYVITIDGGSWYCFNASGTLSPTFYIDVKQG